MDMLATKLDALCELLPARADPQVPAPSIEQLAERVAAAAPAFELDHADNCTLLESRGLRTGQGRVPPTGQPSDYQLHAIDELAQWVDIAGKRILEIGPDVSGNVLATLAQRGARFGLGIDNVWPREYVRVPDPRVLLAHGDVLALPYADAGFDVVLNIATFEHILELRAALLAMLRLLRPGGLMYALFAPLWSSAVGHHIWCDVDGHAFRFTDPAHNPIGDFEHLLYDRAQLAARLRQTWHADIVEQLVAFIYDSTFINRLFHHEIEDIVRSTNFEILDMQRTWTLDVPPDILAQLHARHGERSDYSCAGMRIVLRKPAAG